MPFEPQNKLERSLMQAATDPSSRPQFYRDFLESDIFVIQDGPPSVRESKMVLEEGYPLSIEPIQLNGKDYLPIFSSLPRLQAVLRSEAGYIALKASAFLEITRGADLVLNPGSDYGKEFTAREVASILDGSIWQPSDSYVVQKETRVIVGQPANYPSELAEALERLFRKKKGVKRAWLAHFFNPEHDQKPHTLVAVEAEGEWDQLSAEAGMVAQGVAVPDPPVDFYRVEGRGGLEDYFLEESKPFYERRLFGIL